MNKLNIIGCGGHARSVADVAIDNHSELEIRFYDENAIFGEQLFEKDGKFQAFPLQSMDNEIEIPIFIAIGDNYLRHKYAEQFIGKKICSIISKRAYVSKFANIDIGNFVGAGAHVGPEVHIGVYNIINTHAIIEHETVIGDYCHISVNSTVCGRCVVGNEVFVGAGAVVRDKIHICDNVVIGANAVVVKNITSPGVYVGNPAKAI